MRAKGGSPYLPTLVKIPKGRRHLPLLHVDAEQDKLPFYSFGFGTPSLWDRLFPLEEPYHPFCFTDAKSPAQGNTHGVATLLKKRP